jgi:hypothetical protein
MSATVTEITTSRTHEGTPGEIDFNVTLSYAIQGTDNDQTALTALLSAAPATYTANSVVLRRDSVRMNPEYVDTGATKGLFFAEVRYITPEQQVINQQISRRAAASIPDDKLPALRRAGNISSTQVRRVYSLDTISTFGDDAPDFSGAIEVDEQGAQGVDIFDGQPTFTVQARYSESTFLSNRAKWQRYANPAHVNDAEYEGYAAGEVLYLGCDYVDDFEYDPDTDTLTIFYIVTFNFAVSANGIPAIAAGSLPTGVTLSSKDGWDYLWIYRERPNPESAPEEIIPLGVYYEQVYARADFDTNINLPGVHDDE